MFDDGGSTNRILHGEKAFRRLNRVTIIPQRLKDTVEKVTRTERMVSVVSNVEQDVEGAVAVNVANVTDFDVVVATVRVFRVFWPPQCMAEVELGELLSIDSRRFAHECKRGMEGRTTAATSGTDTCTVKDINAFVSCNADDENRQYQPAAAAYLLNVPVRPNELTAAYAHWHS